MATSNWPRDEETASDKAFETFVKVLAWIGFIIVYIIAGLLILLFLSRLYIMIRDAVRKKKQAPEVHALQNVSVPSIAPTAASGPETPAEPNHQESCPGITQPPPAYDASSSTFKGS